MKQVILFFLIVYAVERLLETDWKRTKLDGEIIAAYSLPLIVTTYVAFYRVILWDWHELNAASLSQPLTLAGMGAVIVSALGRNWAIKRLGVYHSINIEIRERQELVQSGPYSYLRNPYYLSNIIEAIGLPLVVNSKLAMFIALFVYIPILLHRLILEEKALEKKFEDRFIDYKRHVPMIFPRFCKSMGASLVVWLRSMKHER
jgi:protein-S-isoprenylcysteine O-methyltransferase Ste14